MKPGAELGASAPPEDSSHGTYESVEERRRQAGARLKSVKQEFHAHQANLYKAEEDVRHQHGMVEGLKHEYAALSYLALGLTDEAARARVYVQGAQLLSSAYPATQYFRGEGVRLVAGFERSVQQQVELAADAQRSMAQTADLLQLALGQVPLLEDKEHEARQSLEQVKKKVEQAQGEWRLLLHTRNWSRQRW